MAATTLYTGKVVMAERIMPTDKHSASYDGQYLITHETDSTLYGLRLDGRYGGLGVYGLSGNGGASSLALVGEAAYRICAVEEPRPWMLDSLDIADAEIEAVTSGKKKPHWIMSVYEAAFANSRRVREALEKTLQTNAAADAPEAEMLTGALGRLPAIEVTVPPGTQVRASPDCIIVVIPEAA